MNAKTDRLAAVACFGAVVHERHAPVRNRFVYPVAFLRLPLSMNGATVDQIIVCADYSLDRHALREIFDLAHGRRQLPGTAAP